LKGLTEFDETKLVITVSGGGGTPVVAGVK
jgi:hypothetical protein